MTASVSLLSFKASSVHLALTFDDNIVKGKNISQSLIPQYRVIAAGLDRQSVLLAGIVA